MQVARLATELGVTHLHAHFATVATTVARLAGKITGLPYSFTAHAKDIFHEDVVEEDLAAKFADAHHAVTISGYNKRDLDARFPASADRIHLVHNGLELDRFPYAPRPESGLRLLSVGRLVEKKGLHLLVDAAAALHGRGVPVTVDIAGDGPLREDLARQIHSLGLGGHVRLLGPVTQAEVTRLLGECDVFVAPLHRRGGRQRRRPAHRPARGDGPRHAHRRRRRHRRRRGHHRADRVARPHR
ncbi:glycosyltransferase [Corynebacterium suedekumii]|nr:glycosyltransferase [Corynebacterium suedekumii]